MLPFLVAHQGYITPSLDFEFLNGVLDPSITCTRSGATATYFDSSGILQTASANAARFDHTILTGAALGLRCEEARTNIALWNRDFTNAAWVKVNTTAAKNQTGIDGAANSASTITATSANGTILQTVVLASSARFVTAYVKRVTGSGTVNMTLDGGLTWTPITVTAAWTRVSIPTQTFVNPVFGFQIVTSGDAIAVDYFQNENGISATTPIATTTVAVARSVDQYTVGTLTPWYNTAVGTLFGIVQTDSADASSNRGWGAFSDNTGNNSIVARRNSAATAGELVNTGGVTQANINAQAWTTTAYHKHVIAWAANDFVEYFDGTQCGTDGAGTIPTVTQFDIGRYVTGGALNGCLKALRYYPFRLNNAALSTMTK